MYKDIYCNKSDYNHFYYLLRDDDFFYEMSLPIELIDTLVYSYSISRIIVIVFGYLTNNKAHLLPKNIAWFCRKELNVKNQYDYTIARVEGAKQTIDREYPHIEYGKKYHPCVIRQIQQLKYGKVSL